MEPEGLTRKDGELGGELGEERGWGSSPALRAGSAVLLTQGILPAFFPASAGPSLWGNGDMERAAGPPASGPSAGRV